MEELTNLKPPQEVVLTYRRPEPEPVVECYVRPLPASMLPPPELPQPEKPGVPMTDGTPMACRQKNAAAFLAGDVQTSVMAHYAPGLFSTKQKLHSRHPAPDEDNAAVLELVEWREDAPYG